MIGFEVCERRRIALLYSTDQEDLKRLQEGEGYIYVWVIEDVAYDVLTKSVR